METETYKKAREILEKFDPARFKELEVSRMTARLKDLDLGFMTARFDN
jgi:hypothetical protein